jgi:hypothetical protein
MSQKYEIEETFFIGRTDDIEIDQADYDLVVKKLVQFYGRLIKGKQRLMVVVCFEDIKQEFPPKENNS